MAREKASPKDITGSLVHFKKSAPDPDQPLVKVREDALRKLERPMAFDPLGFGMWTAVCLLIAAQFFLMVSVSLT